MNATDCLLADVEAGDAILLVGAYANFLYDETVDWRRVNFAIIERWSVTRLRRIKEAAWLLHEESLASDAAVGEAT